LSTTFRPFVREFAYSEAFRSRTPRLKSYVTNCVPLPVALVSPKAPAMMLIAELPAGPPPPTRDAADSNGLYAMKLAEPGVPGVLTPRLSPRKRIELPVLRVNTPDWPRRRIAAWPAPG